MSQRGNNALQEFEDTIRTSINSEITSLFVDYTLHCVCQIFSCLCVFLSTSSLSSTKLVTATGVYFLCGAIFRPIVCFKVKPNKTKRMLAVLDIARNAVCAIGALSIYAWNGRGLVGCFMGYLLLLLSGIVTSCINLAESTDQTFMFKLVDTD